MKDARRAARDESGDQAPSVEEATKAHSTKREAVDLRALNRALLDENKQLKETLGIVDKFHVPKIEIWKRTRDSFGDAVPIAVASDWHVEEPVNKERVHSLNEYNLEIAEARAQHFFRNALKLFEVVARDCRVKKVMLLGLGDFFTNYIHEELREINLLGPTEAADFALKLLASGLDYWLRESSFDIDTYWVAGNHGRMTVKPRKSNVNATSLEWFMYRSLAKEFADNRRVRFTIAPGKMLYVPVFERFNMRLIHGDDIGYQGGIGGVTIPLRKKVAQWDKAIPANVTVLGHWHKHDDGRDYLINGSLIGYNEYAQSIGASPEEAVQAFFSVHARNGGSRSISGPIWLDDKHLVKSK